MVTHNFNRSGHGAEPNNQSRMLLWQAVLLTQVRDLFHIKVWDASNGSQATLKSRECVDAENWVGKFPSQNFILVCSLAGFEPNAIHERLIRIMALPAAERAQISFASLGQNSGELWTKVETLEAAQKNTGWENNNG